MFLKETDLRGRVEAAHSPIGNAGYVAEIFRSGEVVLLRLQRFGWVGFSKAR